MKILTSLLFIFISMHVLDGQIGRLALSPVQTIEQKIGLTDIAVVYSRPSMRGRDIFGGLVPYHQLWRTGANRNTTIEFSQDVIINDKRIEAGKYAIFSIPSTIQWEVIFYKNTDNWDVPEVLDFTQIATSIVVPVRQLNDAIEAFTISIGDFTNYEFALNISWSNVSVSVPVILTTREAMDTRISDVLEGPSYNDYYAAAVYQMESGKEYQKGLQWINKAMSVTDNITWWDLRVQAKLLLELGRHDESLKVAKEGLLMAKKVNRAYGINEFNILIDILED